MVTSPTIRTKEFELLDSEMVPTREEREQLLRRPNDDPQEEAGAFGAEEGSSLDRRTVRKLDFVLLPFLSLLFLLNSLDRSNIGNAETAHFTRDAGLQPEDLNVAVACFFAFFVLLQPFGAAAGRKIGMARWVPSVMALWGACTAGHVLIKTKGELIAIRIFIGILEAGFYPTTVSYLSLFYTRFEFARRLGLFYGQYAIAGALGGLLSYAVFSRFPPSEEPDAETGWQSWQVLFILEGGVTVIVALVGFFWLPRSADTAWFLTPQERVWAEERVRRDREGSLPSSKDFNIEDPTSSSGDAAAEDNRNSNDGEQSQGLLSSSTGVKRTVNHHLTADSGLSRQDILSATLDWKIWYLLVVNICSSIPSMAFSVFLPMIVSGLGYGALHAVSITLVEFSTSHEGLWTKTVTEPPHGSSFPSGLCHPYSIHYILRPDARTSQSYPPLSPHCLCRPHRRSSTSFLAAWLALCLPMRSPFGFIRRLSSHRCLAVRQHSRTWETSCHSGYQRMG